MPEGRLSSRSHVIVIYLCSEEQKYVFVITASIYINNL